MQGSSRQGKDIDLTCDETYPKCRNCQRFGKSCSYAWADPYSKAANIADISSPTSSPENHAMGRDIPSMVQLTFDALDMKLMHHFSTSTARSLSLIPDAQHIWQHSIPNLAYEQPLLMHGILALAGTHLAYSICSIEDMPRSQVYVRALHHQQLGLQLFRHQLQYLEDTTAEYEPLVMFSAIICILTFAQLQTTQENFKLTNILEIFAALRGKRALWASVGKAPHSQELAKLLYEPRDSETPGFESELLALAGLQTAAKNPVLKDAIIQLRPSLVRQAPEFRLVGGWPTTVSDDFITLLQMRDSMALQILQSYCAVLSSLRDLWWVGDCGEKFRRATGLLN
ncbi:hypothetical protein GCG54_00005528 [Colletotrichum gloeosporioides]|uniref:Zn(2)-C6 fungal-type domain-containing protein n=1 Tax=Colletotrichum gloeosporioides TaxID=474922 RepID=A0A8H4CCX5_COLGL|nr:uncharacterized protein GCG54_00005528 [Colletotrichum gloeosporioides]KAF3801372.1 hypothetical protein GCG54_00005528 [Colletotrichum gloeosporioides]